MTLTRRWYDARESLLIRPATLDDVPLLAELGARTFSEAYGHDNRPEDIELVRIYLEKDVIGLGYGSALQHSGY